MRAGLQKLGRWTAGRLQGSKGVEKYDKYMEKSPLVRGLLKAGDIAGAAYLGGAALGGGLGFGSVKAGLSKGAGGVKSLLTGNADVGKAASSALKFGRENKDLIAMAGKGIGSMLPDAASDAAMMRAETERMQFEDERKQREARQRALQEYFMPMLRQMQQERKSYGG